MARVEQKGSLLSGSSHYGANYADESAPDTALLIPEGKSRYPDGLLVS